MEKQKSMEDHSKIKPPSNSSEFDKAYNSLAHWVWSDIRIPKELKELVTINKPKTALELGCGLGRFSNFMAENGIQTTGVDFSTIAIKKANKRIADKKNKPTFLVGDVTNLKNISEQFDMSFDVGCFHCLDKAGQEKYSEEVHRLLKPGGILLLWSLDNSPGDIKINPEYISNIFGSHFRLTKSKSSRRRVIFVASHWYWLVTKK
jgi:SAM-dependent methyltransferase